MGISVGAYDPSVAVDGDPPLRGVQKGRIRYHGQSAMKPCAL